MSEPFPSDRMEYLELLRDEIPRYDELQDESVKAIPFAPGKVLELGIGTGETARRLLESFPEAQITGLDSTPEMVFSARDLVADIRLARMEDPLPDGPWDLVIAVLAVHHLPAERKQDLFRRVREQARCLVLGDVVKAEPQLTPADAGIDFFDSAAEQAEWSGGEVVWEADDLAVIRAVYD
jgi:tRNA (cmo5U34)-methyltransferase